MDGPKDYHTESQKEKNTSYRWKKKKEGIYVYIQLIHFAIQEKITEHYKATLRQ